MSKVLKKVSSRDDIDNLFINAAERSAGVDSIGPTKYILHISVKDDDTPFEEKVDNCLSTTNKITEILWKFNLFAVCGYHNAGKDLFARLLQKHSPKRNFGIYSYLSLRDSLLRGCVPSEYSLFYSSLIKIESEILKYFGKQLKFGRCIAIADCGMSVSRRQALLDACDYGRAHVPSACVVLARSVEELVAEQEICGHYLEKDRDFLSYLNSTKFVWPRFSEGFGGIIIINTTKPLSPNYITWEFIEREYRKIYSDNRSVQYVHVEI